MCVCVCVWVSDGRREQSMQGGSEHCFQTTLKTTRAQVSEWVSEWCSSSRVQNFCTSRSQINTALPTTSTPPCVCQYWHTHTLSYTRTSLNKGLLTSPICHHFGTIEHNPNALYPPAAPPLTPLKWPFAKGNIENVAKTLSNSSFLVLIRLDTIRFHRYCCHYYWWRNVFENLPGLASTSRRPRY